MKNSTKARVTNFLKEYLELCLRYSICIAPREPNDLLALNELAGIDCNDIYSFDEHEIDTLLASDAVLFQEDRDLAVVDIKNAREYINKTGS